MRYEECYDAEDFTDEIEEMVDEDSISPEEGSFWLGEMDAE